MCLIKLFYYKIIYLLYICELLEILEPKRATMYFSMIKLQDWLHLQLHNYVIKFIKKNTKSKPNRG